ncbi:MAG: class I SAM-dependent rRNA methyltransferase [Paracoccaceae bacterium]|nr:class I SAM-dependent rRNA methyltransferase [Paracoccaceae bacterium]
MTASRPVVRLKPKTDPRRIRFGFPWVYANELVTDRRTKAMAPGSVATLEDADRKPLATVTVNSGSKIIARVLDSNPDARVDADWLKAKIASALDLRERLYDAPFYRLVHAEGDGLPGLIIDRFGDTLVIQPNASWVERLENDLCAALVAVMKPGTIIKNAGGRTRALEGLSDEGGVLLGEAPALVPVPMNGATYFADVMGGQKTGLFFDQRPNHAFVQRIAKGTDVLDVFSHVGGFSLAAMAGGAKSAIAVDGSKTALQLAEKGAEAARVAREYRTIEGDAFDVMASLSEERRVFGTVICDPPAFAPSKNALDAGLRAYEKVARLSARLVEPGGTLTLCSCSHAADLAKFRAACIRGIGRAGRRAQILRTGFAGPDHPQHPQLAESGYLKSITFRMVG